MHRFFSVTANAIALRSLLRSVVQYRELLWEMTRRDLVERQAGLAFAGFWIIGQPLLMMLVYVFVFSFIFDVRLSVSGSRLDYTAFLLAGLVPWLAFQEAIGRAPTCIVDNRSLIKQIVFPIEIVPLKLVLSTLVVLAIGLAFPLILTAYNATAKPLAWLLLPVPILCHLALTIGLAFAFAATGVFLRDIRNVVQLGLMIGLFVHPILYVPNMLPKWVNMLFLLSPFSHVIYIYRDVIFGEFSHDLSWFVAPVISCLILMIGFRTFQSLRHKFGDAL